MKFNVVITKEDGVRIGETVVHFDKSDVVSVKSVANAGMQVRRVVDDFFLDEAYKACSRKIESHGVPSKDLPVKSAKLEVNEEVFLNLKEENVK